MSPTQTGYDARFPNQNQTKHCWQNYVDYHKCILAKGEDFKPCRQVCLEPLCIHIHTYQEHALTVGGTVLPGLPLPLPERLVRALGRPARKRHLPDAIGSVGA